MADQKTSGIPIQMSFVVGTKGPIDSRLVVDTFEDLNNIDNKYEGLVVYVKNTKKVYLCENPAAQDPWIELIKTPSVEDEVLIIS